MERFRVKVDFFDLEDNRRLYHQGDVYPRAGYTPSEERIAVLSGAENKAGIPLIEPVNSNSPKKKGKKDGQRTDKPVSE